MAITRRTLGGVPVDLCDETDVHALVTRTLEEPRTPALAIASANLDHIHAFAAGRSQVERALDDTSELRWLTLLDGAPLVASARLATGRKWPRLAGSDLLLPILLAAAEAGIIVGFLGGASETHDFLAQRLESDLPSLKVGGYWAPPRSVVTDPLLSDALADEVARAKVEILVVGLGKPRQEQWIQRHGARTRSRVLLAFGAAINFLAGTEQRAPRPLRDHGLEWAYRLGREPRRLGRRYLVQGPAAALRLARYPCSRVEANPHVSVRQVRRLAAVVVTYNNESDISRLLASIPAAATGLDVSTIVVDNGSSDQTRALARQFGVTVLNTGRNAGYAGGINVGRRAIPDDVDAVAILNPDLVLRPHALTRLAECLTAGDVGVSVPMVLNPDGSVFASLRRDPTILGALGEAAFGDRWPSRPAMFSDTLRKAATYRSGKAVAWASGACWVVAADCDHRVGAWDESFFLYSEEVDYARRVREAGFTIEYVPEAVVEHVGGASGRGATTSALMAVNRVRDYERHHGRAATLAFRTAVAARHFARSGRRDDRAALVALMRRSSWPRLPSRLA